MHDEEGQIRALLGPDPFRWAVERIGGRTLGRTIDDVRYRDLVTASDEQVHDWVDDHGFDPRTVSDGRLAEDLLCITPGEGPEGDPGWAVSYVERGRAERLAWFPTHHEARHDVVDRLLERARILLNHRYRLAHPDEDLPPPSEM